jgi:hypothetical protein
VKSSTISTPAMPISTSIAATASPRCSNGDPQLQRRTPTTLGRSYSQLPEGAGSRPPLHLQHTIGIRQAARHRHTRAFDPAVGRLGIMNHRACLRIVSGCGGDVPRRHSAVSRGAFVRQESSRMERIAIRFPQ